MKVSDAIKRLQEMDEDEVIVFTLWTESDFAADIHYDDWVRTSAIIERKMDWSYADQQMIEIYENWSDE